MTMSPANETTPQEQGTEVPFKRSRRKLLGFVIISLAIVGGLGIVASRQGWFDSIQLPFAGADSDESRLDGFEIEVDQAVKLLADGDTTEARVLLSEIVRKAPNHVLANYNLGVIAQFEGDLQEAVRRYSISLAGAPLFRSALYNRGLANRDIGDTKQAVADLSAVVANYPDAAAAAYNLGALLIEQGDLKKGNALLARAKRLDPSLGN